MKVITKEATFKSNDYSDSPTHLRVTLSAYDIENIKKCQQTLKDNPFMSTIRMSANIEFFDEVTTVDGEELVENEWRSDVQELIIYPSGIYAYAQNKYDSGDQIESDCIEDSEIFN